VLDKKIKLQPIFLLLESQIESMRSITRILAIAALAGITLSIYGQEENREGSFMLMPLSPQEEVQLQSLPELKPPAGFAERDLPAAVDNSTQIYMRPVFQQDGLSCGQASSIGYNFTYEMSRERNISASQAQNQYPTHFAWNFMNGPAQHADPQGIRDAKCGRLRRCHGIRRPKPMAVRI
jgi:hypothetical protein